MTIATFAVTYATMRAEYFPHLEEFSAVSNPQATTVTTIISQKAAGLANLLAQEGVSATAVEALTATDPAYLWCQETLALMVAVRLLQLASGKDPKLAEVWRDELVARLKDLAERGAAALGNASLDTSDSPANGPATHITYLGLDLPDADDASSIEPLFRKDDLL